MNFKDRVLGWILKTFVTESKVDVKSLAEILITEGIHRDHAIRIAMKVAQGQNGPSKPN